MEEIKRSKYTAVAAQEIRETVAEKKQQYQSVCF
jgi:hypothetical protein